MGQPIEVAADVLGAVAIFDTDRGLAGQAGRAFPSADAARLDGELPGELAVRIFESDPAVHHVAVMSNQVVARRSGGWADGDVGRVAELIRAFFVYYEGPEG